MLPEVYSGRCKGKKREREGRREGLTGVERRANCRTGLQFCHCPAVHASSIHMATSTPAELHGLVIQALLCLNRLSSGSFGCDGNAQASSPDGSSNGTGLICHPSTQGLLLLGHAQALGIQLREHRGILSLCHGEHRGGCRSLLLPVQWLQRQEGYAEYGYGGCLLANSLSFLLSFSKAFGLSLIKSKWY